MRYPEEGDGKGNQKLRYAFEMRHKSFFTPVFYDLLNEHGATLVFSHGAEKYPYVEEVCNSDFVYLRYHGEGAKYKKGYGPKDISAFGKKVKAWSKRSDVFCYFTTEAKEYSPKNAQSLLKLFSKS